MAYIRTTTVKGHKYLQLVESYRDNNGVVQKRVLEHLGPAGSVSNSDIPKQYRGDVDVERVLGAKGKDTWASLSKTEKKEKIPSILKEEAENVWGDSFKNLENKIDINVVIGKSPKKTKKDSPTHLKYKGRGGSAIGDTLLSAPREVELRVAPWVLEDYTEEKIRSLMRHEALHLGYGRHTHEFRSVAEETDAPISEQHAERGYIAIQMQENKGERYKTIETMETYSKADARARELADENPNKRYRLNI